MFTSPLENTHVNERNEYRVADGISAVVFRAILVSPDDFVRFFSM